jgi:hypothetical protein
MREVATLLHDTQCQLRSALGQAIVEDQSARFRVWAGNLGAFQKLPAASSLDHRLREAPKIATQIQEILEDLRGDTDQSTASRRLPYAMLTDAVCAIASGDSPNRRHESEDERDKIKKTGCDQPRQTMKKTKMRHHSRRSRSCLRTSKRRLPASFA